MHARFRVLQLRALRFGTTMAAGGAVALALRSGGRWPHLGPLLTFAVLVVVAEHAAVLLPSSAGVSTGMMMTLAGIAAFGPHRSLLGACVVGALGGLSLDLVRGRKFGAIAFNSSQILLAAAAAAVVYEAIGVTDGPAGVVAGAAAAGVYVAVNATFATTYVALDNQLRLRRVWTEVLPTLPNLLVLGVFGVLLGQFFLTIGLLAVPLMITPLLIGRLAFASYQQLREAHDSAVRVFVRAIEAKDRYTAGHCERVAKYAQYIGEELALTSSRLEHLRYAALMHDIGKLAVPSTLLNKPGRLTEEEYARIQRHNEVCVDILTRVDFLRKTVATASDRHAHYDADEAVDPGALEAYIVAVADAFDAMTSTRAYRRALAQDVAFAELRARSGTQFHPQCAAALIAAVERRGEHYGLGHEDNVVAFKVAPPEAGLGSAGLGDLATAEASSG